MLTANEIKYKVKNILFFYKILKKKKKPSPPKKPLCSFFIYKQEEFEKLKNKIPKYKLCLLFSRIAE